MVSLRNICLAPHVIMGGYALYVYSTLAQTVQAAFQPIFIGFLLLIAIGAFVAFLFGKQGCLAGAGLSGASLAAFLALAGGFALAPVLPAIILMAFAGLFGVLK